MQFELTILGSSGAIAVYDRHPSAQILDHNGNHFLIDCGEGTQFRMNRFGIKRGKLDNIFISHLHGDHCYGLIGLLTSFNLNWREHPLNIYGPEGLKEIMDVHFKYAVTHLKFEINYHIITADTPRIIYEDHTLEVETIVLKHRIPTTGFLFREKPGERKMISEKIKQYNIPYQQIPDIKKGMDFISENGSVIPNAQLTHEASPLRSYAYCSDTVFTESFIEQIKNVGLLYHEATFIEEHATRATETFHSTAKQAAQIAKKANVGKLLLGHFSARYENLDTLLLEAREIFPETYLAAEGKVFSV